MWELKSNYADDAITVVGKWAYSLVPGPAITHATLRIAAWMYRQKDAQVFEPTAMPGLGQLYVAPRIPQDIDELLGPFKRLVR